LDYNYSSHSWRLSGGYEAKLIQTLSDYFNFTHKIINCANDWGIQLPNKTWTGIIGKIVSKVCFKMNYYFITHYIYGVKLSFSKIESNS
jgi:hypothetical protein